MLAATQQWHARSVRRPTCPPPESMHCRGSLAQPGRSPARSGGGSSHNVRACACSRLCLCSLALAYRGTVIRRACSLGLERQGACAGARGRAPSHPCRPPRVPRPCCRYGRQWGGRRGCRQRRAARRLLDSARLLRGAVGGLFFHFFFFCGGGRAVAIFPHEESPVVILHYTLQSSALSLCAGDRSSAPRVRQRALIPYGIRMHVRHRARSRRARGGQGWTRARAWFGGGSRWVGLAEGLDAPPGAARLRGAGLPPRRAPRATSPRRPCSPNPFFFFF